VNAVMHQSLAAQLAAGIDELGIQCDAAQQEKLLAYVALLAKWNKVYNLTAVREPERMIGLHILDSLALVPHLFSFVNERVVRYFDKLSTGGAHHERGTLLATVRPELVEGQSESSTAKILDVGSGGGLPGICLAIAAPVLEITMLDSLQKKTTFVRQAIGELALSNANVVCERVEKYLPAHKFDIVTSRAFAELADFVNGAAHLVAPHGKMLAMKGVYPHDEIARLPKTHKVTQVIELHVPQIEGARHLVMIESVDA
jgi:16S rRNA (guanine527-N7)-methyltransferase